jgi:hypothetical protein
MPAPALLPFFSEHHDRDIPNIIRVIPTNGAIILHEQDIEVSLSPAARRAVTRSG